MAYSERKPIYEVYEEIIKSIVGRQQFKDYAISEIDALDKDLLIQFNMIREKLLFQKYASKSSRNK